MWDIIMRNWDLREFQVQVNLPIPIWQVWLLIRLANSPIWGILTPLRNIIPLICHIRLYLSYHSYLYPSSLFLLHNSTIIAQYKFKSSLSISRYHDHESILSTAYTEYSIQHVQHPPKIDYLPFILTITMWPLNVACASSVPSYELTSAS